jgi:hypothetical protein
MLEKARACPNQFALFRETFPDGAPLTLATYRKCVAVGLDFFWAAGLLSPGLRKACDAANDEARKVYGAAIDEARKVYDAAIDEARKVYDAAIAEARKAYDAAIAEARKAYDAACYEAWKVYEAAHATILLRCLRKQLKESTHA